MSLRGHPYPGLWINFESGEGSGKGLQQKLLVDGLKRMGFVVSAGREPGTTLVGEKIRSLLQDPNLPKLNPKTEMLLYVSAGVEIFEQEIKPLLEQREIFVGDRWRYSTMAHQGYGLGIDLDLIDALTKFSCTGAYPDITLLLDIAPELGLSKITGYEFSGKKRDKIESRKIEYHQRVRKGYLEIAQKNPERFRIIPYIDGKPDEMNKQIIQSVDDFIKEHNLKDKIARS